MRKALSIFHVLPDMATDCTLWHLQVSEGFSERLRVLNIAQRRAIKHFLKFMKEHCGEDCEEDVAEALDGYWGKIKG